MDYKYLCCNKNYQDKFDKKLTQWFFNTYKFSYNDNNKFILLLRKDVHPYEKMHDWEKFNEISLPKKEDFYSHLNVEDITDADYAQAKEVSKDFEIKKIGRISWFVCFKWYIIISWCIRNVCIEICELDPAKFFLAPGLAWQAPFKKPK